MRDTNIQKDLQHCPQLIADMLWSTLAFAATLNPCRCAALRQPSRLHAGQRYWLHLLLPA